MADGGLLLNFATGDLPVATSTPKYKGGSWKDRARLRKAIKGPREPTHPQDPNNVNRIPVKARSEQERPAKRLKFDHERPPRAEHEPQKHIPRGDRPVISSLFTYNPIQQTTEEVQKDGTTPAEPVKPTNAPLPDGIDTFTSLGLSENVAAHLLTKMALKTPTSIQKAAVSQLVKEDNDVFIQSETGSGKTLAYLLPIVQRIVTMADRQKHESSITQSMTRDSGLFAIVLAPTRELCKQISVVLEKLLGCAHFIVAGTVIGGEKKKSEKARLRKGINILVATPGRLVDHLDNTKTLDVSKVRYLVLDEGDRLMDLGFEEDITKIVKHLDQKKRKSDRPGLPENRISVLCSATLRANVEKLGNISLKDAVLVKSSSDDVDGDLDGEGTSRSEGQFLAPAQLKQSYIITAAKLRLVTLIALLRRTFARKGSVMKAIVFLSCADSVDFHHHILTNAELANTNGMELAEAVPAAADSDSEIPAKPDNKAAPPSDTVTHAPLLASTQNPAILAHRLHGSLPQPVRTAILKSFATSTTPSLLLATDVAARGLDLPNLDLVIEYDPAFSKEDHLHRIGRTARLGRDGRAIIFLMPGCEEGYIQVLRDSYTASDSGSGNVTSTSADETLRKGFTSTTSSGLVATKASDGADWQSRATELQLNVERYIVENATAKEMARKAYTSYIRAYATHIAAERVYFDIKHLHLGHLAKAFGLRDPPGKVNVAGLRNGNTTNEAAGVKRPRGQGKAEDGGDRNNAALADRVVAKTKKTRPVQAEIDAVDDVESAAAKMRQMVRKKGSMTSGMAEEFNIG